MTANVEIVYNRVVDILASCPEYPSYEALIEAISADGQVDRDIIVASACGYWDGDDDNSTYPSSDADLMAGIIAALS